MRLFLFLALIEIIFISAPALAEPVKILSPIANAMSEPNMKSESLVTLKKGQVVDMIERKGDWIRVNIKLKNKFKFKAWLPYAAIHAEKAEAAASKKDEKTVRYEGAVVYITLYRAYINLGEVEGVETGAFVTVLRENRPISTCEVEETSDHSAICTGRNLKQGDKVVVASSQQKEADYKAGPTVRMLASSEIVKRATTLMSADFKRVVYVHNDTLVSGHLSTVPVSVSGGYDTWYSRGSSTFQRGRADLSIHETGVGVKGVTASTDLSTWVWTDRPSAKRFRPKTPVQFYVWEASVKYSPDDMPLKATVGRIRPYSLPGVAMFDGAQVGWKIWRTDGELGVYGGEVPNISTLYLSKKRWMTGMYFEKELIANREMLIRQETRIGLENTADFGNRLGLETLWTTAWKKFFDLSVDAKAGLTGGSLGGPTFDALRVDVGMRPTEEWRFELGGRLLQRQTTEVSAPVYQGARHADLTTIWQHYPWMDVMVNGGASQEVKGTKLHRYYVGPEFRFPKLMGPKSNLSVSYQEEFGWLHGRMLSVQPSFTLSDRFNVLSRASVTQDVKADQRYNEYDGFLSLQARFFVWLTGRVFGMVQTGDGPLGVTGGLEFNGQI